MAGRQFESGLTFCVAGRSPAPAKRMQATFGGTLGGEVTQQYPALSDLNHAPLRLAVRHDDAVVVETQFAAQLIDLRAIPVGLDGEPRARGENDLFVAQFFWQIE